MKDNSRSQTLNEFNKTKNLTLEEFEKQLPRKMTIYLLSNNLKDCEELKEKLTKVDFKDDKDIKDIKDNNNIKNDNDNKDDKKLENKEKKINLFSFMNYRIYDNASNLMSEIENKVKKVKKHPKSEIFSEVMIILDNSKLKTQIEEIKNKFKNNSIMQAESYYIPFLIIISPHEIDLNDFLRLKTFHYKISLKDILSFLKGNKDKNEEASDFIRKLNVLFCYYNELGDEFSFINSKNKLTPINIEDDTDITIFVNFLLLGRTGVGKSKLINTLLEEMKSIEGGTGFSTTSKKIIVYRKKGYPIRFYDVPGIEDGKSVQNYIDIMEKFKMKEEISYESINAIFYCIEYKDSGTIIYNCEKKLFEKLIQFEIPIIFIITKTPYDPEKPASDPEIENERKGRKETIENDINEMIEKSFEKINKKNDAEKFIKDNTKIVYVNLVEEEREKDDNLPIFGINKILTHLSKLVPEDNWEKLKEACKNKKKDKCKELLKANIFLKYYSDFEKLQKRNEGEAEKYLKRLEAGAFFSGMVPGLDIGMEYYYRSLFQQKLKSLYNFDYDKAIKALKENNIFDEKQDNISEIDINDDDSMNKEEINKTNNVTHENNNANENGEADNLIKKKNNNKDDLDNNKKEEKSKKDSKDIEIKNAGKIAGSTIRGIGEVVGIALKALPETGSIAARASISAGLKLTSWILLPITCIGFGSWSLVKVKNDCNKILNTFEKASPLLIYETVLGYVESIEKTIEYFEKIGENKNPDDEKKRSKII